MVGEVVTDGTLRATVHRHPLDVDVVLACLGVGEAAAYPASRMSRSALDWMIFGDSGIPHALVLLTTQGVVRPVAEREADTDGAGHHGAMSAIDELPARRRTTALLCVRGYVAIGCRSASNPSLRHYRRAWLATDVAAGVTVGALTIPSALGYAEVAGAPSGLRALCRHGAEVVFTRCGRLVRHLVLGPDGAFAALIGATLAPLAAGNQARAVTLAPVLAFLVGGLFLLFGLAPSASSPTSCPVRC